MVEIHGSPIYHGSFLDQPRSGQIIQIKMRSEDSAKFRPPCLRHFFLSGRHTREQSRGRELQVAARMLRPVSLYEG